MFRTRYSLGEKTLALTAEEAQNRGEFDQLPQGAAPG